MKRYKSGLSAPEIFRYIEHLKQKESGFWRLKGKVYDVKISVNEFVFQKRGGNSFGPAYPVVKGRMNDGEPVLVSLDIKLSYGGIIFCVIISVLMLFGVLTSDKVTINGAYKRPGFGERIWGLALAVGIPAIFCYFKNIRQVKATETWLIRKFRLKEVA
ncbi:MAG TPA: hypothetical protein VF629_04715 [Hymenobacter sp.]|uniref:hypothetical protein n=1 Tax=Hymenobacter sp. TaxID=1898978 RepID=UPI002EDAE113